MWPKTTRPRMRWPSWRRVRRCWCATARRFPGLFPVVDALLADPERMRRMAANIRVLGIADSAERIVDEIVAVVRKN